jgi:hypothetical protein
MRNKWIVAAAIGVLTAMPAMASDTCLADDTECKQAGSGGRIGQAGSGIGRVADTDETCSDETCLEGGWAGGGGRQSGSGGRTEIQGITWSRTQGIDGRVTIAARISFADGSSTIVAFEE